jgi:uncharacterized protein involved in exopolysaccharide biosynthesis
MQSNDLPMELSAYWSILKRRKWHFALPFLAIVAIAVAIAFLLPAVFRSEATILIQRQTIPQALVATTVTGYVQEQISQIQKRITTFDNLLQIADDFSLYLDQRETDPVGVVDKVRENIEVKMVDVQASDPNQQGGPRTATIAFTIAYHDENPATAKAVTEELARRFLEVHRESRGAMAAQVSGFLNSEAESIRTEIAKLEEQLAGFKQEEFRQLPELMDLNLQLFERAGQQIEAAEQRIRTLQDQIDAARAELSLTQPYQSVVSEQGERILSASERLSMLTAQYLQASARYSSEHPDVVRLSREIRILAEQTGNAARADELMGELIGLQEQLRQARQQYADGHPEVLRLESAVAAVQRGLQTNLITAQGGEQAMVTPPDNPRYVALKTQLESAEANLAAERQKLAEYEARRSEYEERLYQTPVVERDYKLLSRGYEDALRKHSELNQKLLEARMAESLESGTGGEQWALLSPPVEPILPERPNRIGIALLGILLAFAAGMGLVTVVEYLDKTVRSARAVVNLLGAPPLAVIPRMGSAVRTQRRG